MLDQDADGIEEDEVKSCSSNKCKYSKCKLKCKGYIRRRCRSNCAKRYPTKENKRYIIKTESKPKKKKTRRNKNEKPPPPLSCKTMDCKLERCYYKCNGNMNCRRNCYFHRFSLEKKKKWNAGVGSEEYPPYSWLLYKDGHLFLF